MIASASPWVLAINPGNPSLGLQIAAAVVVAAALTLTVVTRIRRRRWRRELGLKRPGSEAWRGPNAPPYERLNYQRRDDSGQG